MQSNIKHLYADVKIRTVFTTTPSASFRTARNLKIHLVRSKLYPLEREKMAHGSVNSNFA